MPYAHTPGDYPLGPGFALRLLIARLGYAERVTRDVEKLLRLVYRDLAAQLADELRAPSNDRGKLAYLNDFMAVARERLQEVTRTASRTVAQASSGLGTTVFEATNAQGQVLRASLGLPSRTVIINAARYDALVSSLDIGGLRFQDWWQDTARLALGRMRSTVQTGIVTGQNSRTIARQIIGQPQQWRGRSLVTMHAAQWHTAVRTTFTAVQAQASLDSYRVMPDVVPFVIYTAILDQRTSRICAALDGRRYAITDPDLPRPPQHPNCRSDLLPDVEAPRDGVSPAQERRVSYDQWLRAQPPVMQDAVLGRGLADLYRAQRLALSDLIAQDRTPYTLTQVRQRLGLPADPRAAR